MATSTTSVQVWNEYALAQVSYEITGAWSYVDYGVDRDQWLRQYGCNETGIRKDFLFQKVCETPVIIFVKQASIACINEKNN